MITSLDFKNNFFETTFNISKNTVFKLFVFTLIIYAIFFTIAAFVSLFFFNLDFSFIKEYFSLGVFERDEFLTQYIASSDFVNNIDPSKAIKMGVVAALTIFPFLAIVSSWFYNFLFLFIDDYIKNDKLSIQEIISKSFSKKVFTILWLSLIFIALIVSVELLAAALIYLMYKIHIALAIIGGFALVILLIVFLMRFILAMPHIVNTNDNAFKSLSYSFKQINYKTALKYFAIVMVAYIVMFMASMMIVSLQTIGGVFGLVVVSIFQLLYSAFTMAFMVAATLGLYYTYNASNTTYAINHS